jgi:hypothetical protein
MMMSVGAGKGSTFSEAQSRRELAILPAAPRSSIVHRDGPLWDAIACFIRAKAKARHFTAPGHVDLMVKTVLKRLQLAAAAALLMVASPAWAVTDVMWWHAMSGELGRQLEKLAADFNASQSEYRVVPSYKGNYTETVTAAIFAFRSRSQPAIVQVNEIATATMMAAKGAIYPVFELMRDEHEAFSPTAYLPAVTGYYSDSAGNMLSFPFNAATPILYYNKNLFRAAGLDPDVAPKTWPELGDAAKRLRAGGAVCGFTTSWPSWINVENLSAFHNLPISTRANGFDGLDAVLTFNNPVVVRHVAQLAEWQTTKAFDYSGRATSRGFKMANAEFSSAPRLPAPTSRPIRNSRSAMACCRTGPTWQMRRKIPSSAAPPCGCCATVRAPNTMASRNSSASCQSRRFRRPGIRKPAICR